MAKEVEVDERLQAATDAERELALRERELTHTAAEQQTERARLEQLEEVLVVTAQIWYPKIWAKFSLFALHCIMAYIFKLLIKYFKQWKTLKGSKHSQYSHTKCICSTCQTKYS